MIKRSRSLLVHIDVFIKMLMMHSLYIAVAVHTDSWLLSVAFFHSAKLSRQDKKKLFDKCNELPSLYETITGKEKIVLYPKKMASSSKKITTGKAGTVIAEGKVSFVGT